MNFIELEQAIGVEALSGCIESINVDLSVKKAYQTMDQCSIGRNKVVQYAILRSSATCAQVDSPSAYIPTPKDEFMCKNRSISRLLNISKMYTGHISRDRRTRLLTEVMKH